MAAVEYPVIYVPLRQAHWAWIRERAMPLWCEDTRGIVAVRGKDIAGAVVMDSWTATACSVHIAIEDKRVTRRLLKESFRYIFSTAGRRLIIAMIPSTNFKALRFAERIGFKPTYRLKEGFAPGVDFVIHEMRKENCLWIPADLRQAA